MRRDALLRSINDRLGMLCSGLCDNRSAGVEIPVLSADYLDELFWFAEANAEDLAGDEDAPAEEEDA